MDLLTERHILAGAQPPHWIDAFGADRVFWGSDLTRLPGSYRECITMFTEELDFLSDVDIEATMGRLGYET